MATGKVCGYGLMEDGSPLAEFQSAGEQDRGASARK